MLGLRRITIFCYNFFNVDLYKQKKMFSKHLFLIYKLQTLKLKTNLQFARTRLASLTHDLSTRRQLQMDLTFGSSTVAMKGITLTNSTKYW